MPPTALIIGSSSQLGKPLRAALERSKYLTVGTAHHRAGPGLEILDVTEARAVREIFDRTQPVLVFLAVNNDGGVDYCESHPREAEALHVAGTKNVVEGCSASDARLVYFSTDYVFDGRKGLYDEEAPPAPLNAYGRLKLQAENIIRDASSRHLVVRTNAVYSYDPSSKNFAMQLLRVLKAGKTLRVPDDQWCNPTPAEFLCEASASLAVKGFGGIYNVAGRDWMTRLEFARRLARSMGLPESLIDGAPTEKLGQTAPRPLKGGLSTAKLERALETAPWGMEESLERFRLQALADLVP